MAVRTTIYYEGSTNPRVGIFTDDIFGAMGIVTDARLSKDKPNIDRVVFDFDVKPPNWFDNEADIVEVQRSE